MVTAGGLTAAMGGQWPAIMITLVAATGNNIGKALQKEATRQLPRFSLDPAIMTQYARSREWLIGLAADLGGALLMIAAFALAPVSIAAWCSLAQYGDLQERMSLSSPCLLTPC